MTRTPYLIPAAVATSLSLAACAATQDSGGPSLAPRSVEARFDVAQPAVAVEPPGPLPTDLAGRLARWHADAEKAQQDFAAARHIAAPLVSSAAGSAVSSERWVAAPPSHARLIAR